MEECSVPKKRELSGPHEEIGTCRWSAEWKKFLGWPLTISYAETGNKDEKIICFTAQCLHNHFS